MFSILNALTIRSMGGARRGSPEKYSERHLKLLYLSRHELVIALKSSHVDTVIAFQSPKIGEKLSFNEMIEVFAAHQPLVYALFQEPEICKKLDSQELVALGKNYFAIASHILDTPSLYNKLATSSDWINLIESHPDLIMRTLQDPTLYQKICDYDGLFFIASKYPTIATYILNNPALWDRPSNPSFARACLNSLGRKNADIAIRIFNNPMLRNRLLNIDLTVIAKNHSELANSIFNNDALRETLDSRELANLGKKNADIALRILTTPALCDKLAGDDVAWLGKNHLEIARYILRTEELYEILEAGDLIILGKKHCEIAKDIIDTEALFNMLLEYDDDTENTFLIDLVEKHPNLTLHILSTPTLCNKLDDQTIAELAGVQPNADIAHYILDTRWLCDRLNGEHLAALGNDNTEIAHRIMSTKELWDKLLQFPICLLHFLGRHPIIGARVADSINYFITLANKYIRSVSVNYHHFALHSLRLLIEDGALSATLVNAANQAGALKKIKEKVLLCDSLQKICSLSIDMTQINKAARLIQRVQQHEVLPHSSLTPGTTVNRFFNRETDKNEVDDNNEKPKKRPRRNSTEASL